MVCLKHLQVPDGTRTKYTHTCSVLRWVFFFVLNEVDVIFSKGKKIIKETKEADFETGDTAGKKATWVWC